jgi:predicted transglutaminase-like cysteine proteinase
LPAPGDTQFRQATPIGLDTAIRLARIAVAFGGQGYKNVLADMTGVDTAAMPPRSEPRSSHPMLSNEAPDVFRSKAIAFRKLPALEKLKSSYDHAVRNGLLDCEVRDCSGAEARLARELRGVAGANPTVKAAAVNIAVNRLVSYRRDIDQYRTLDYWAAPVKTLRQQAGDCEDYAILKMALLEELGVPASSMSVVVLKDERRNLVHAILALRAGREYLVLDNMRDQVLRDSDLPHYSPFYSLSAGQAFIHGRKIGSGKMMASVSMRAIAPGEGPTSTESSAAGPNE